MNKIKISQLPLVDDITNLFTIGVNSLNQSVKVALGTLLNGKVDKVSGKGLSTNDYTTAEKTKVANLETTYVAQVSGKGLSTNDYTNADKTKLSGIDTSLYVEKVTGKGLSTNDFIGEVNNYDFDVDSKTTRVILNTTINEGEILHIKNTTNVSIVFLIHSKYYSIEPGDEYFFECKHFGGYSSIGFNFYFGSDDIFNQAKGHGYVVLCRIHKGAEARMIPNLLMPHFNPVAPICIPQGSNKCVGHVFKQNNDAVYVGGEGSTTSSLTPIPISAEITTIRLHRNATMSSLHFPTDTTIVGSITSGRVNVITIIQGIVFIN